MKSAISFLALWLASSSAAKAQIFFADEHGRAVEFTAPSIPVIALSGHNDSADEVAYFFRQACLDSKLDLAAVDAAVSGAKWPMKRSDVKIPFNRPEFDTPVPQWVGSGRGLTVAPATYGIPTGSGFRVAGPQCTFVSGTPSFDRQALETALTNAIGTGPHNASEAVKKNGKPNKRYEPRWLWTGPNGVLQEVGFALIPSFGTSPGKLQVALIPPKPAKKK